MDWCSDIQYITILPLPFPLRASCGGIQRYVYGRPIDNRFGISVAVNVAVIRVGLHN